MIKKLLILMMFILMSFSVIAVAPSSVVLDSFEANDGGTTYLSSLTDINFYITVVDEDSEEFNCSINLTYTDVNTGVNETPTILSLSLEQLLNNTERDVELDNFAGFQELNDIQPYTINVGCTDGVDTTYSNTINFTFRGFFLYTEDDLSKAVINASAKVMITIGTLITLFVIVLMVIWGKKTFKENWNP